MYIHFENDTHTYRYYGNDKAGEVYPSVSGVFKQFQTPYDAVGQSLRMCLRDMYPEEYRKIAARGRHKTQQSMLAEVKQVCRRYENVQAAAEALRKSWSDNNLVQTNLGTDIHSVLENRSIAAGYELNPFDGQLYPVFRKPVDGDDNRSHTQDLWDLPDGYYPELLLHDHEWKMAGQTDKAFIKTLHNGTRIAWLDDWKTDKEMSYLSYKHPVYGHTMLKGPLSHLHDSKINMYTIKISMYAAMLERAGFVVGGIRLTHINKHTFEVTPHPLLYRRAEVFEMMKVVSSKK